MDDEKKILDAFVDAAFTAQIDLDRMKRERDEALKFLRRLVAAYAGENTLDRKSALMAQVAVDAMAFLLEVDQ
jgi:hypothetical protein